MVDGPGGFLPDLPSVLEKTVNASFGVPTLSGITADDGSADAAFCKCGNSNVLFFS